VSDAANAEQIRYWNDDAGPEWARHQDRIDENLRPFGEQAMAALDLRAGHAVLDVGCGCGQTSLALADRVGRDGHVTGVDISAPMLAAARQRALGRTNVEFRQADAQSADLSLAVDRLFSRFGIMFFADPVVAFANLARAVVSGGRLAFVCWQHPSRNPWMAVVAAAAVSAVPDMPPAPPLDSPGPFAFSSADRVRSVLADAGWTGVSVDGYDRTQRLGSSLDDALEHISHLGPLRRALAAAGEGRADAVYAAVRDALGPYTGPGGVSADASAWIVTATKP
jgi:SAM-dependent methyltransferase